MQYIFDTAHQLNMAQTEWQEDWCVTPTALEIAAPSVKGTGADVAPPEDAVQGPLFNRTVSLADKA